MIQRTRLAALAVAATALCSPARAADLVLYDALDFAGHVAQEFTARTGVTVDVVEPGSTGETLGKIAAEGDHPQFDIVWLDGSAVMQRMAADHVLQPVPADLLAGARFTAFGKTLVPADRSFLPTGASTTAIEVDTRKVPVGNMPTSWADLEHFAGHVAAKDPNLSGPAYQWLAGFFQTVGEDKGKALLLRILTEKSLSGLSSGGKVNKAILTGDAVVGINQDSAIIAKREGGEPVVAVYPAEGSVALPQGLGISAGTEHMAAVQKFVAFILSPEGQAAMQAGDDTDFYFMPIVEGVQPKAARPQITFIQLDDKTATAHETAWKQWYREHLVP